MMNLRRLVAVNWAERILNDIIGDRYSGRPAIIAGSAEVNAGEDAGQQDAPVISRPAQAPAGGCYGHLN